MWSYFAGEEKKGPVSQDELLKLYNDGAITGDTPVQAEGSGEPVAFEKTLMFKSVTPPPEPVVIGKSQIYEYKIIEKDSSIIFGARRPTEQFETEINEYAKAGWELDHIIQRDMTILNMTGKFLMIFRRKVGGS